MGITDSQDGMFNSCAVIRVVPYVNKYTDIAKTYFICRGKPWVNETYVNTIKPYLQ